MVAVLKVFPSAKWLFILNLPVHLKRGWKVSISLSLAFSLTLAFFASGSSLGASGVAGFKYVVMT